MFYSVVIALKRPRPPTLGSDDISCQRIKHVTEAHRNLHCHPLWIFCQVERKRKGREGFIPRPCPARLWRQFPREEYLEGEERKREKKRQTRRPRFPYRYIHHFPDHEEEMKKKTQEMKMPDFLFHVSELTRLSPQPPPQPLISSRHDQPPYPWCLGGLPLYPRTFA